ncbi:hypothetical protein DM826_02060 [Halonotius aquaticus]|uniref:histidine kinase n=1 Tax=Halonotius aquaticus TaxID=2216978 RepID=A0A3A6PWK1_9EURY|nr:hypothetical protein DM826_02060 [Halonotius aquaticus]
MAFQLHPQVPVLGVTLLLTMILLLYSFQQYHQRRRTPELLSFIGLLFAINLWQLTAIFIHTVTIPAFILAGINFGNAVVALLFSYSLAWFALTYSGYTRWVNRWTVGFAVATIGATSLLVLIEPELWTEVNGVTTRGPVTIAGITFAEWIILDRTLEPAFRVFLLYNYLITVVSGGILGRYLLKNKGDIYTGQAVALGVGAGAPIGVSTLLFLDVVPPTWNPTHIAFGVTAVGFAVAIFRYRLLGVAPIGRQQLVEQLADPVVMLDDTNRVVDCNLAARELVNAPAGWRGMSAAAFFEPLPEPVEWFMTAESGELTLSMAGTERTYTSESVPITNDSNTHSGQLIRLHEITEQKARQRQLQEQNEYLDEFASIISHELQSPLNVAIARLKLIKREYENERIDELDQALGRMDTLIEDLLTMARSSQSIEDTDPVALETAAKTAWTYSDIDHCELTVSIPDSLLIEADRDRLFEVFENLYVNAAEHNDTPVSVRVGLLGADNTPPGDARRSGFFVADDGKGIPADKQDTLFQSGYTDKTSGSGFGLAIVQEIISAHGWEITVTESTDGGARFEISGVDLRNG